MIARRRWGFRARLTALIAAVFILGGTVLLGVQYVLVQQLFSAGISTISGCVITGNDSGSIEIDADDDWPTDLCGEDPGSGDGEAEVGGEGVGSVVVQQATQLSQEVLSGLLVGSAVTLVVFTLVAVLAAAWLSKRSLGRIAHITQTAREITQYDLHRRLDLAGPDDEVKELGDTIDDMLDRLDEAFTRQERFVAGASHELRTPLTTTRIALEIPLAEGRIPAEVEPDIRLALAANERSEQLIAALLTLAQSSPGRAADPTAETADLAQLAAEALHEQEPDAHGRRILVAYSDGGPVLASADRALVRIAVTNLVENAIQHNRDDGALTVRTGGDHGTVWIEVENDGRELTEAEVAHLTEPFNRGPETRLAGGGIGLGLTLVETIARSQRGVLTLAPRSGGGLTARLILPAQDRVR